MKNKDKKEKNTNKRDNIFMIILSFCDVIAVTVLFLLYGPYNGFRDWLVTTAMGTMNHQYLATTFYNMDRIEEILSHHSTVEPDFNTDTSLITADENEYIDDYDREILDRNKNDVYKIIEIDEDGYSGYLAAVYDPSKIKVTYSKNLGVTGEYLVNMAKREGAVLAINGGGFVDIEGMSNGGQALGAVISNGKIVSVKNVRKTGMTEHEELLMLRALAAKQAQELEASRKIIEERDEKIRKQNTQIDNMIQALLHARKKIFGPSTEVSRQVDGQLSLFESVQELAEQLNLSVSASKHGVVQHNSFSVMISTSLFEALFSSRFQMTLLRQIF